MGTCRGFLFGMDLGSKYSNYLRDGATSKKHTCRTQSRCGLMSMVSMLDFLHFSGLEATGDSALAFRDGTILGNIKI